MQTTPDPGALANRRMRLALTRLLLSLTPLAACGLLTLLPWATYPVVDELYALGVLPPPAPVFYGLSVVLYLGAFIGCVVAVVIGVRVLRGDQQQPPLQPVVGLAAAAGFWIGIVGILFLVYSLVTIILFIMAGGIG